MPQTFQAKKRQSIDARLQAKLAKEQNLIRKQDEAKKDRLAATRKEEDLSVKDGIVRYLCPFFSAINSPNAPYL